jgi:hypothetical protein
VTDSFEDRKNVLVQSVVDYVGLTEDEARLLVDATCHTMEDIRDTSFRLGLIAGNLYRIDPDLDVAEWYRAPSADMRRLSAFGRPNFVWDPEAAVCEDDVSPLEMILEGQIELVRDRVKWVSECYDAS